MLMPGTSPHTGWSNHWADWDVCCVDWHHESRPLLTVTASPSKGFIFFRLTLNRGQWQPGPIGFQRRRRKKKNRRQNLSLLLHQLTHRIPTNSDLSGGNLAALTVSVCIHAPSGSLCFQEPDTKSLLLMCCFCFKSFSSPSFNEDYSRFLWDLPLPYNQCPDPHSIKKLSVMSCSLPLGESSILFLLFNERFRGAIHTIFSLLKLWPLADHRLLLLLLVR